MHALRLLYFLLVIAAPFNSNSKEYNVLDFGALGDGEQLETQFIQKAIDIATVTMSH